MAPGNTITDLARWASQNLRISKGQASRSLVSGPASLRLPDAALEVDQYASISVSEHFVSCGSFFRRLEDVTLGHVTLPDDGHRVREPVRTGEHQYL